MPQTRENSLPHFGKIKCLFFGKSTCRLHMVSLKETDYPKYQKKVRHYIKLDLLILDDFMLHTSTDEREIKVLFEIMEKRNELSRSTICCSQRDPKSWPSMILNDEVSANSIMKRATKHYTVVIQPMNEQ